MADWQSYTDQRGEHTVTGELLITQSIYSPQLQNQRHLLVWLPPSYRHSKRRYPVIYMHDGDNLFDRTVSYSGEWQVDESLTTLADEGLEAIVVGIPNMGDARFSEYSPYDSERGPGKADLYLQFLIETIKPLIDADFRTYTDAPHTGIVGSSMGGLISLYGFLQHPDVFWLCGSFSPVFWYGDHALYALIQNRATGQGRVYLDVGGREGTVYANLAADGKQMSEAQADNAYRDGVRRLHDELRQQGYDNNLLYVEDAAAQHNEAAWAQRLPAALIFLLQNTREFS